MFNNLNNSQYSLLQKLIVSLLDGKEEHLEPMFRKAIESIRTFHDDQFQTSFSPFEEQMTLDSSRKFIRNSYTNADEVLKRFNDIFKSLQSDTNASNTGELLQCLLLLGEYNQVSKRNHTYQMQQNEINGNISLSTDFSAGDSSNGLHSVSATLTNSHSSHESEKHSSKNRLESPNLRKNGPIHHLYTDTPPTQGPGAPGATSSKQSSLLRSKNKIYNMSSSEAESNESPRPNTLQLNLLLPETKKLNQKKEIDSPVTEYEIMKELIFCMQGIEGNVIHFVSLEEGFTLDPGVRVEQEYIVKHLMELGYLHNLIKYYMNSSFAQAGIVAQGLLGAVRRELTDYYQSLAVLDSELSCPPEIADTPLSEEERAKYNLPTLSEIFVWSRKPLELLKTLCDVLRLVHNKRGGEIVSALAFLSCNGNPRIREIILRLLSSSIQPFYKQILHWVVYGEIIDTTHEEFFINSEISVDKNSWDKRFVLRPAMIPNYMSKAEANQILETGRGMNFLHNICLQRPPMTPSQENLLELEKKKWGDDVKSLIQPCNQVSELIDKAYREVSKIVLQTLCKKFKMTTHLEALRKYMLLGQGDFIHHLLEIIEPDLNKPVGTLHTYSLMRSLEDAIYKSNAQFDDPEVLKKLWVNTLVTSEQENFCEVFCLQYKLDGPLIEIFKSSLVSYNRMFTFMWRVKRAHHMVLKMWRGLKLLHKEVHKFIPETKPVFHQVNGLIMEMMNFLNHFQYYIASEVVEVEWRKFREEMDKMESLEKVLDAHTVFLRTIKTKCMLNDETDSSTHRTMTWHIRTLLDYVQELVPVVETFQTICEGEEMRRKKMESASTDVDMTYILEQEHSLAVALFSNDLNKVRTNFKVLSNQFHDKLKSLLLLFSKNYDDNDLIALRHRIDCNNYYKLQD